MSSPSYPPSQKNLHIHSPMLSKSYTSLMVLILLICTEYIQGQPYHPKAQPQVE